VDKTLGFADPYGTRIRISFETDEHDPDPEPTVQVSIQVGMCSGVGFARPELCRQIAATLLDAADECEAAE
jgi:hypothetical protein